MADSISDALVEKEPSVDPIEEGGRELGADTVHIFPLPGSIISPGERPILRERPSIRMIIIIPSAVFTVTAVPNRRRAAPHRPRLLVFWAA